MEQTVEQIANAISTVAEAVIQLHDKGLITTENMTKANGVLGQLLDKASESVKSMMDDLESQSEEVESQGNFVEEAWKKFGVDLNFVEDYCKNLSLLSGMDDKGLRWAIEKVFIIQDTDPTDGTVSHGYMKQLEDIDAAAKASGDVYKYYLQHMTGVVSNYMSKSPDSCK